MGYTLYDYAERIKEELQKDTRYKPERKTVKNSDVIKALKDLEACWGKCMRKGWIVFAPIHMKPYTNKAAQLILTELYKQQKIFYKQRVMFKYKMRKKNGTKVQKST